MRCEHRRLLCARGAYRAAVVGRSASPLERMDLPASDLGATIWVVTPAGIVVACLMSAIVGYVSSRLRSTLFGVVVALLAPLILCYSLAWGLMSPLILSGSLGPSRQAFVALMTTGSWSFWAAPISIASFALFRWRRRRIHAL